VNRDRGALKAALVAGDIYIKCGAGLG